ncbi:MAG TPA: MFS transporter, partial [Hanamia sp.]|nr:MFS transporter [Hanamia sp.]
MAPATKRGTANSTYLTGFDLGVGIGLLIGGVMAQYFNGFSALYLLCSVLSIIALIIYVLSSKGVYEKNKLIQPS